MSRIAPLRRGLALWLCPELAPPPAPLPVDPIDLPLWGAEFSRPRWWGNVELRVFLTASHRNLTMAEARAEAVLRFGEGVPSLSAIHRYWQRLDALRDAAGTPMQPAPQVRK